MIEDIPGQPLRGIDPSVLVDDDGRAYLYCASRMGELKPDMKSVAAGSDVAFNSRSMPGFPCNDNGKIKMEGPYVFTKERSYYLLTAFQGFRNISWSPANPPLGPFTYRGMVMEKDPKSGGNNHISIVSFLEKWRFFHHRHLDGAAQRNACVEPFEFNQEVLPLITRTK